MAAAHGAPGGEGGLQQAVDLLIHFQARLAHIGKNLELLLAGRCVTLDLQPVSGEGPASKLCPARAMWPVHLVGVPSASACI